MKTKNKINELLDQIKIDFDSSDSQNKMILNYLKSGKTINQIEALHLFGCFRLSARIYDLKRNFLKNNEVIQQKMIYSNNKKFAEYSLI